LGNIPRQVSRTVFRRDRGARHRLVSTGQKAAGSSEKSAASTPAINQIALIIAVACNAAPSAVKRGKSGVLEVALHTDGGMLVPNGSATLGSR